MVTVITMITGELDYGSIFGLSYDAINATTAEEENIRNIPYPETANLVWVIFLVFVPILLSNMLVWWYLCINNLTVYTLNTPKIPYVLLFSGHLSSGQLS